MNLVRESRAGAQKGTLLGQEENSQPEASRSREILLSVTLASKTLNCVLPQRM